MDEIVGEHFGVLYRPDERRAGEPNRAIELAIQKGKHEVEGWRVRKNGAPFYVTGVLTAIRDDDQKLIGFANIIRDATERRDAQEKLVEAREQLAMAQKMEAIGKLTGGIAHDFNNLLMIIGGNAETFRRLLDPKLPRALEAIQTAAKRGESLTRQLLTFSRSQHLSPRVLDLTASIRNMRTLIESSLRGNIVYNEKIDPDIWPVKVDLAELELAIVNIAVNARDAMPNGGVFTLIAGNVKAHDERLTEPQSGDFVALECNDTGMGIPPTLLSKIFDPFFTTKEVGKGTGLGLSQVYGFAHQAGGFVRAASKVGHGTAITVYLPCADGLGRRPVSAPYRRDTVGLSPCCGPTRGSRYWERVPTRSPSPGVNGRGSGPGSRSHGLQHSSVCNILLSWQHLSPSGLAVLHLELELKQPKNESSTSSTDPHDGSGVT